MTLDCTKSTMPGAVLKRDVWGIAATPATAFATAADVTSASSPMKIIPSTVLEHYQGEEELVAAITAARAGRKLGSVSNGGSGGASRGGGQFGENLDEDVAAALGLCYLWGVLASLTPCFYPMIPTTIALFSGASGGGGSGERAGSKESSGNVGDDGDDGDNGEEDDAEKVTGGDGGGGDDGDGDSPSGATAAATARTVGRLEVLLRAVLYVSGLALTYACLGLAIAAGSSSV